LQQYYYYIIYKPFQVLSQFSKQEDKATLGDFFEVEKNVYPIGRLDYDSEGLLLLTNDKQLNNKILDPQNNHKKNYWVQVDGSITNEAIDALSKGVSISVDGKSYITKPAIATKFLNDPIVAIRNPAIRFRKNIPTSWLSLTITEGKNRQVRKMTAAVGFATLRLIRFSIEDLTINTMQPGEIIKLSKNVVYNKLFK
jgi:23S rRNA pseudouridine2457 synthase